MGSVRIPVSWDQSQGPEDLEELAQTSQECLQVSLLVTQNMNKLSQLQVTGLDRNVSVA